MFSSSRIRERFDHIRIAIRGETIQEKESIKILGVTLTNDLKWDVHTRSVINNLKYFYRSFSRSCRLLTTETRRLLYNSAIASRIGYCDMVWDCCSVQSRKKLQSVQNRCARRILNRLPGTPSAPLLDDLGWISLEMKRKVHKCVMLHKMINGKGPKELIDMLSPLRQRESNINTRGVVNDNLFIPRFNTDYVKKSFYIDVAKTWNSIPAELRSIKNSHTFKVRLQAHYLDNCQQDRLS